MPKLSDEFTPRILDHILGWGKELSKNKKSWTEWDAKIYFLVYSEIRKIRRERYQKSAFYGKTSQKRGHRMPQDARKK